MLYRAQTTTFSLSFLIPSLWISNGSASPLLDDVDDPIYSEASIFGTAPTQLSTQKVFIGAQFLHGLNEQKLTEKSTTQDKTVTATERHLRRSAGFSVPLGGALGFAISALQDDEEVLGKDSTSRFNNSPVQEPAQHRQLRAKIALDFSKSFRVAAGVRNQWTTRTILGSYNLPAEEKSQIKGSLLGADFGIQTFFTELNLGICYLTEQKGKLDVEGENLVSSHPGLLQATVHWHNNSGPFQIAFAYGKYFYADNELLNLSTGPNPRNRSSITLLGLSPESRYARTQKLITSFQLKILSKFSIKLAPFYETGEYNFSDKIGDPKNASNLKSDFGGDLSLGIMDSSFELALKHSYFEKQQSFSTGNNTEKKFKSNSQITSLTTSVSL